ncbi:hypothetical protein ACFQZ4_39025 [Catellatospora coxensis]|uniref:hypothetical protein n=1 Tax=Catellatospora coxensis TaxID=310354 RepID=UPI001942D4C1|nr:hypothetical protein [Catellatospora coxensis]
MAATGFATTGAGRADAGGPTLVPLVAFHSPSRGDYFTTTQEGWVCQYSGTCPRDAGYQIVGMQGHVYNPANPQPAGTVPLFHWWNPSRGDNFLTTDPNWSGNVGDTRSSGVTYTLFRIEGFVPTTHLGGIPLRSYWNAAAADNAAIATWRRDAAPSGYAFYRHEGFLLPPEGDALTRCTARAAPSSWEVFGQEIPANAITTRGDTLSDGDATLVEAAWEGTITTDYWGHVESVYGYSWSHATPGFPAPGEPPYAMVGRVTTGAMFVSSRGWYEAGSWFPVLGTRDTGAPSRSPCLVYRARGVATGDLQLSFNDPVLSDNGGLAYTEVDHWFG